MAAAAPLTAAQEAALKAEFGKVFNGVRVKAHTAMGQTRKETL